jgi:hypothetical protein
MDQAATDQDYAMLTNELLEIESLLKIPNSSLASQDISSIL